MKSRRIKGYESYEITDSGDVYRVGHSSGLIKKRYKNLPRKLSPGTASTGYYTVGLTRNGKRKTFYIHDLVAKAFIGPRPKMSFRVEIAHLDGNKKNNNAGNLAYVSCIENNSHKRLHGTHRYGEKISFLSPKTVLKLRAFRGSHAEAARALGVEYVTAYYIRKGRSWKYLTSRADTFPSAC